MTQEARGFDNSAEKVARPGRSVRKPVKDSLVQPSCTMQRVLHVVNRLPCTFIMDLYRQAIKIHLLALPKTARCIGTSARDLSALLGFSPSPPRPVVPVPGPSQLDVFCVPASLRGQSLVADAVQATSYPSRRCCTKHHQSWIGSSRSRASAAVPSDGCHI